MAEDGEIAITKTVVMHIHVHHHFDEPLTIDPLTVRPRDAVRARLLIGTAGHLLSGVDMTAISIDETGEIATVSFQDDHGNDTTAPAGTIATFTSSDETILTADNSVDNLVAKLTPVGVGSASLSVALTDADGNPSTLPAIDPVSVSVDPGAAVGARLSLSDTTP